MFNKIALAISILVIFVLGFFVYRKYFILTDIHYHAGFRVFVDGTLQDFSGPEYMSLTPCSNEGVQEDEQHEKAHLHDRNGHVVHVHRDGAVWRDLFVNINYPIEEKKPFVAYVNGKRISNLLDEPIQPYDTAIVLIGRSGNHAPYLKQAVTRKEIEEAEKKSENCGGAP